MKNLYEIIYFLKYADCVSVDACLVLFETYELIQIKYLFSK